MAAGSAYHQNPDDAAAIRGGPRRGEASGSAGGVGLLSFAGWFLLIAGVMHGIWGIVALAQQDYFAEGGLLWSSLNFWGWIALIIALAQLIGGGAVLARSAAGSVLAMAVAAIGIVFNFLAIGAYPIWSVIMIVANAIVIYAISSGGDELM